MKFTVAAIVCMFLLGLFVGSLKLTVTLKHEAAIYEPKFATPLNQRAQMLTLDVGDRVEVLECIDTKSDQYLKVRTMSDQVGYLYALDVQPSVSFSFKPKIEFEHALECGSMLLTRW